MRHLAHATLHIRGPAALQRTRRAVTRPNLGIQTVCFYIETGWWADDLVQAIGICARPGPSRPRHLKLLSGPKPLQSPIRIQPAFTFPVNPNLLTLIITIRIEYADILLLIATFPGLQRLSLDLDHVSGLFEIAQGYPRHMAPLVHLRHLTLVNYLQGIPRVEMHPRCLPHALSTALSAKSLRALDIGTGRQHTDMRMLESAAFANLKVLRMKAGAFAWSTLPDAIRTLILVHERSKNDAYPTIVDGLRSGDLPHLNRIIVEVDSRFLAMVSSLRAVAAARKIAFIKMIR